MEYSRTVGGKGEVDIAAWLRRVVGPVERRKFGSPWDMTVNGLKIEAKCSESSKGKWHINIHRKGNSGGRMNSETVEGSTTDD